MRDQIAHTIMTYSWYSDHMEDMESPVDAYELADMILSRSAVPVRWCVTHERSVSDPRATACLSGAKDPCSIEVRYLLRNGPSPSLVFTDEDFATVRDKIKEITGVRHALTTIMRSMQLLERREANFL